MGRGLGKLLAQKGANIVIVARDQQKLAAALEYISVSDISHRATEAFAHSTSRPQPRTHHPSASTASAQT